MLTLGCAELVPPGCCRWNNPRLSCCAVSQHCFPAGALLLTDAKGIGLTVGSRFCRTCQYLSPTTPGSDTFLLSLFFLTFPSDRQPPPLAAVASVGHASWVSAPGGHYDESVSLAASAVLPHSSCHGVASTCLHEGVPGLAGYLVARKLWGAPHVEVAMHAFLRSLCCKNPDRCADALSVCATIQLCWWSACIQHLGYWSFTNVATSNRSTQHAEETTIATRRHVGAYRSHRRLSGQPTANRARCGRHCFVHRRPRRQSSGTPPPAAALQPVAARNQSRIANASQSTPGSHAGLQPLATCWGFRAPAAAQPARDGTAAAGGHDGPCACAQDRR